MRAILSFTICGGLAMPWARTVGACMASARPTAVVKAEAASNGRFMITSPLAFVRSTGKGSTDSGERLAGHEKILFYRSDHRGCNWGLARAGLRKVSFDVGRPAQSHTADHCVRIYTR